MRYYYKRQNLIPEHGAVVGGEETDIFRHYTEFKEGDRRIGVIQQYFDPIDKKCWWDSIDPAIAEDIFKQERFAKWFKEKAAPADISCPIVKLRTIMWELRMRPLKKEFWEGYF